MASATRQKVVFIPNSMLAPAVDLLPGLRRAIAELQAAFKLTLNEMPWRIGSECHRGDWDAYTRAQVDGGHVVVDSGVDVTLMAIHETPFQSFVAAGSFFTAGTRRALGMPPSATLEAYERQQIAGLDSTYQSVRLYTQGASEELQREIAACCDAETDWEVIRQEWRVLYPENVDVAEIHLSQPALYLRSLLDPPGTQEAFLRLFPAAEVDQLRLWPVRLHEEEAGIELASKVIPFIEKHAR